MYITLNSSISKLTLCVLKQYVIKDILPVKVLNYVRGKTMCKHLAKDASEGNWTIEICLIF